MIPLIDTYLRLFSEYEQQTLYKCTSVLSPFCRTFIDYREACSGFFGGQRSVVAMVWDQRVATTERCPPGGYFFRDRQFLEHEVTELIHCTEPKLRGSATPCETLLFMALRSLTRTMPFLTRRREDTEAHPLHRTPVLTISIYTSPRAVKLAVKSSFPYQGKVDREAPSTSSGQARRKGSLPSLSII